jgi:hypothetical protein
MMERKVIDCDSCKKEVETPIRIAIPNGTHRYNDGVESNIDFLYEHKDLCPECAAKMLSFMFRHGKRFDIDPPQLHIVGSHRHPRPAENDAIRLALKFLKIEEKT